MKHPAGILLLLLLTSLAFPVSSAAGDPCDFVSGGAVGFSREQVLACFESVPFRHHDLENLLAVIRQHRSFSDLAELYDERVGWVERLNALDDPETEEDFPNDYAMHEAFEAEHKAFLNPHIRYQPPRCYWQMLAAFVPFDFGVTTRFLQDGESQIVFIESAALRPDLYQYVTGIDAGQFVGMKVVAINGTPVLDYFRTFGREKLALDGNDGVHLNAILTLGLYSIRFDAADALPERSADEYLLESRNGKRFSVTLPWVFAPRYFFGLSTLPLTSSTAEFIDRCREPFPTAPTAVGLEEAPEGLRRDNGEIDRERRRFAQQRIGGPQVTDKDFFEVPPGLVGQNIEVIVPLTDNAIVLQYKQNVTAIRLWNTVDWIDVVRAGIEYACRNSERLILDLRRNGGGNDTVTRWLYHHLFPEDDDLAEAKPPMRVRNDRAGLNEFLDKSALFDSLLVPLGFPPCAVGLGPACFTDLTTGDPLPLDELDWFRDPSILEWRGGAPVSLSREVGLGQNLVGVFPEFDVSSCAGKFQGKNLILLTHGVNASGGYFLPAIFKGKGVIVSTGGFVDEPLAMGMARGGPTLSAHIWAWHAAWMEYYSGGWITFETDYAQTERRVFSNMETWGVYRNDDRTTLHLDEPVEADLRLDVWSDSFLTEGYTYGRLLEAVDGMAGGGSLDGL